MALLGYKPRFVEPLRDHTKLGTVRAIRKFPPKPGETLYHYVGLRTKHTFKIGESQCISINPIEIKIYSGVITVYECSDLVASEGKELFYSPMTVIGVHKSKDALDHFAVGDGFTDWLDMKDFWIRNHGVKKNGRKVILLPFRGIWIRHTPIEYTKF